MSAQQGRGDAIDRGLDFLDLRLELLQRSRRLPARGLVEFNGQTTQAFLSAQNLGTSCGELRRQPGRALLPSFLDRWDSSERRTLRRLRVAALGRRAHQKSGAYPRDDRRALTHREGHRPTALIKDQKSQGHLIAKGEVSAARVVKDLNELRLLRRQ